VNRNQQRDNDRTLGRVGSPCVNITPRNGCATLPSNRNPGDIPGANETREILELVNRKVFAAAPGQVTVAALVAPQQLGVQAR